MNILISENVTYRVAFRLNGGHSFGMGHVVRCLAVAHEIKKKIHVEILFVVNNSPEAILLIEREGFSLKTYIHDEAEEVYIILCQYKPDIIFNDFPHSSIAYMEKIKNLCTTINYDDGGAGCIYADFLLHVQYKTRSEFMGNKAYLYGFKFLILRDEFSSYRGKGVCKRINEDPLKLLIMMGGSDPANLTVKVLKDIQNIEKRLYVNIVIGAGYCHQNEFEKCLLESRHNIFLHNNVDADELLNLMVEADIGVAHYGITGLEMACVGLPFVAIAHNIEELEKNRLAEYQFCIDAGLCDSLKEGDISTCINILLNNRTIREKLSKKAMSNVDAKGLNRVTKLIIDILEKKKR